jgi:hypothetical protein
MTRCAPENLGLSKRSGHRKHFYELQCCPVMEV